MTALPCGCCKGPISPTPLVAFNRPGLSAVVFRVGTYASFRLAMLQEIARTPALGGLRTRNDDDYAITILDMWSTVADVLTFYQERIANEGFLRTARLRDSILRMARLLDYQLRPGVSATTLLAFTLEPTAVLRIPTGELVQSVPAQDEKPQKYETLESISAVGALNQVRVYPAPVGTNPLAKGSTSGLIAPGPEGLAAAAKLSAGQRFLLFALSTAEIEELTVRELSTEEDRVRLTWSGPVQGGNWTVVTPAFALNRTFRIFGYNTAAQYLEATETAPGSAKFVWHQRTFTAADFTFTPTGGFIDLDSKYEGISAGTQLLITQPGQLSSLVTVDAVTQAPVVFKATGAATSPVQDTVTRIHVMPTPPAISDRRNAVIHEFQGPQIRFWGYRYPELLNGGTVYAPARRIDLTTAEIGRKLEKNAYTKGAPVSLTNIDAGRRVILLDNVGTPAPAIVKAAAILSVDVAIAASPADATTAAELLMDAEHLQSVFGLASAMLPAVLVVSNRAREMSITIGAGPARIIALPSSPSTPGSAVALLQAALAASAPVVPEFSESRVGDVDGRLVILAGVPNALVTVEPTAADPTTAIELGFSAADSRVVTGAYSGNLSAIPALTNPLRQISVQLGPIGPHILSLPSAPANIGSLRTQLQTALRAADVAPAFSQARVFVVDSRILILPGLFGSTLQDYVAFTMQADAPIALATPSSQMLGNVVLASHGEKVRNEVLGDGDSTVPFQRFDLQKKPFTYVPSASPGGVASTLSVLVNGTLWDEVPTLFGHSPLDQVYTTRLADGGTVTVNFGDGANGARPASGRSNIIANYRNGSGLGGRVTANALRTPLDLPVGLKSVTNPSAATGGADPETLDQARQNAPATVRTFGRAVSLRDFEDLVRSSGEVAKALATWVWNGLARAVHLTIAGQKGLLFTEADLRRIHASLDSQRDPNHALFLSNFVQVPVVVSGTVRVNPKRIAPEVAADARAALLNALSFESLAFGQPLAVSVIYSVLQDVPGVDFVDLDLFQFKDQTPAFLASRGATADPIQRSLRILAATPNPLPPPLVLAAEQAFIEKSSEDIRISTSGGLPE